MRWTTLVLALLLVGLILALGLRPSPAVVQLRTPSWRAAAAPTVTEGRAAGWIRRHTGRPWARARRPFCARPFARPTARAATCRAISSVPRRWAGG
jgi:hypothetical protein